jgi:hypothetical protein
MSEDKDFIDFLKRSREQIGELEPVILTEEGIVIDGKHRLEAYPGWTKRVVKKSRKEALKERIHRTLKTRISRKERQAQVLEYALYLEEEGVKKENMLKALAEELPFHKEYLRKLLPKNIGKGSMSELRKEFSLRLNLTRKCQNLSLPSPNFPNARAAGLNSKPFCVPNAGRKSTSAEGGLKW